MNNSFRIVLVSVFAAIFAYNCSANLKRDNEIPLPTSEMTVAPKLKLEISQSAESQVRKVNLDQELIIGTVSDFLSENGLTSNTAKDQLEIKITEASFRSETMATFVGFFIGSDKINAALEVKDPKGKVLTKGSLSLSYGIGGLWGLNKKRAAWFLKKISEKSAELLSPPQK